MLWVKGKTPWGATLDCTIYVLFYTCCVQCYKGKMGYSQDVETIRMPTYAGVDPTGVWITQTFSERKPKAREHINGLNGKSFHNRRINAIRNGKNSRSEFEKTKTTKLLKGRQTSAQKSCAIASLWLFWLYQINDCFLSGRGACVHSPLRQRLRFIIGMVFLRPFHVRLVFSGEYSGE